MMVAKRIFIDTNVLIYATDTVSPWHNLAQGVIHMAREDGIELVVSPQVLREYLAATTRISVLGQGAPLPDVLANIHVFRTQFRVVDETSQVIDHLLRLLQSIKVAGKQIHDANLVATMLAYEIPHLLTHNTADFARFAHLITVLPLDDASSPRL